VQTLVSGSPNSFGETVDTWTDKLTTRCNILSGILDVDQMAFNLLPDGFYNVVISRTTELVYKAKPGDRLVMGDNLYKVDLVDESRYTANAYTLRVSEDLRT